MRARAAPPSSLAARPARAAARPAALAHDGGEGSGARRTTRSITNAGFILIAFFPLFVFVMSMIQWRLDKRKDARKRPRRPRRRATPAAA